MACIVMHLAIGHVQPIHPGSGKNLGKICRQESWGGSWNGSQTETSHSGLGGRPSAWCGWEMRQLVGSDPGQEFNLARNWTHWGQAGPAGVGAVVVWQHHVGKIVGQEDGNWIIESGNDGHALRTRTRSIAGAIAIRWG